TIRKLHPRAHRLHSEFRAPRQIKRVRHAVKNVLAPANFLPTALVGLNRTPPTQNHNSHLAIVRLVLPPLPLGQNPGFHIQELPPRLPGGNSGYNARLLSVSTRPNQQRSTHNRGSLPMNTRSYSDSKRVQAR